MNLDLFRNPGDPEPQPPDVGDVILTARLAKLVTGVRPVESKVWHHRWRIETRTIGRRGVLAVDQEVERRCSEGADVRETGKYEKGETPVDFARATGALIESG